LFVIPAQVAAKSLGASSREGLWITKFLVRVADLSGLSFGSYLTEGSGLAVYKDV
jgi:hypothetical protein